MPGIPVAAKCALNLALLDGVARQAGKPLYDYLGLGFREHHHITSFSIGIDAPDMIRKKTLEAAQYPVIKLKVGDARDQENFAVLRSVAPDKPVRVDANEGWKTKEEALRMIEWLVKTDEKIQFVEQPMPRDSSDKDLIWLKERSPLPIFADEILSYGEGCPALRRMFSRGQRETGQDRGREHGLPDTLAGCPQGRLANDDRLHD